MKCSVKKRHSSKSDAINYARKMKFVFSQDSYPYKCKICGHWHLTEMLFKEKKSAKKPYKEIDPLQNIEVQFWENKLKNI